MRAKKRRQLLVLNGTIVLIGVLLFSKALLGLDFFSGTTLSISAAWTAAVVSMIVFVGGNSRILAKKEPPYLLAQRIFSLSDCTSALKEALHHVDIFDANIRKNIEQIERFNRKSNTIKNVLLQKFSAHEMSFQKFHGVLQEVEQVICMNVRSILNKITAFDIAEYGALKRTGFQGDELSEQKMAIYNDYIDFVNNATLINENILLKQDKMLLEISRYNSLEDGDVQRLPAMMEMDELIQNAKLYK